jgi:hypothetical protein
MIKKTLLACFYQSLFGRTTQLKKPERASFKLVTEKAVFVS